MREHKRVLSAAIVAVFALSAAHAAPVIDTTMFIPAGTEDHFVSFEPMGSTASGPPLFVEDGVKVEQINGDGNDIWTYYSWGNPGLQWYPNGGDTGYTQISLDNGDPMGEISMLRWSGNGSHNTLYYELLLGGGSVLAGNTSHARVVNQYIGFKDGAFDTLRMRDGPVGTDLYAGSHQALAIDSIQVVDAQAVSAPASSSLGLAILLVLMGVTTAVCGRRLG